MVALFGSFARNEERADSDIDLIVWLSSKDPSDRQEIWDYWDRHSRHLKWAGRVSLIVRRLCQDLTIGTLLLDMPEEHICVFDRARYFEILREAVLSWRRKNRSVKIQSFGRAHSWKYSTKTTQLAEIDFHLELTHVP